MGTADDHCEQPHDLDRSLIMDGRIEERVQVDRRKLEQMMIAGRDSRSSVDSECGGSTAADMFFSNIMRNTNTTITWPTKLKVGAKTKKDPFVKITGTAEEIDRAKKLILSTLETRHNRVTIKIDVAFTDHSHIIGKQGRNTQLAMKQTACHIHFPDSNRNPDLEKSNMVSIAGPMQTVDQARRILRELAPLVVTLETNKFCDDPAALNDEPALRELANSAGGGVTIVVRTNRTNGCAVFVVRGSVYQAAKIRAIALNLQQWFMNSTTGICSTSMEILQQQHPFVLGLHNCNVQLIAQRTGASIVRGGDTTPTTTFHIHGPIDAILEARRHLLECLPMSFVFESQNECSPALVADLEKRYGLAVSLRPKRNGDSRNIVVKGPERSATAMYDVRRHFCGGTESEEPRVVALDFEFMRGFEHSSPNKDQPVPGVAAMFPLMTPPPVLAALPMLSPLQSPAVIAGMTTPFYPTSPFSPQTTVPSPPTTDPSRNGHHYFDARYSPSFNSSPTVAPYASPESKVSGGSLRSSPTDPQQQQILSLGCAPSHEPQSHVNSNDPVPEEAPLASGLLEAAKKIHENCNHWKAPGAERGGNSNVDYDQQKLLATKAMQEKPLGLRVPNQQWAGLGFSRSMPAPLLRQLKSSLAVKVVEKSIDFGESSASSSSSSALHALDEDEEDKIGPWPLEPPAPIAPRHNNKEGGFNATTYFDSVQMSPAGMSVRLTDVDDMPALLSHLHLAKYVDTFREQEVDMNAFLTMTDADLKELGVNTFGARRKLLVAISEIREYRRQCR